MHGWLWQRYQKPFICSKVKAKTNVNVKFLTQKIKFRRTLRNSAASVLYYIVFVMFQHHLLQMHICAFYLKPKIEMLKKTEYAMAKDVCV